MQWNLSIKDPQNKGHLSIKNTCSFLTVLHYDNFRGPSGIRYREVPLNTAFTWNVQYSTILEWYTNETLPLHQFSTPLQHWPGFK